MNNDAIVVCGLDGVLALLEHRLHYLYGEGGERDWTAFHAACTEDMPNLPLVDRLNRARAEGTRVILLSGRSEQSRAATLHWLAQWHIGYDALWLRAAGDFRPAEEYKAAILQQHYPGLAVRRVYESARQLGMARWCARAGIPYTLVGHNQGNGESREQLELKVVHHLCGHTMLHPFYGDDDFQWPERAAQLAAGHCILCQADERQREQQQRAQQARHWAQAHGLGPLEGSERQVAWAETIRQEAWAAIARVQTWSEQVDAQAREEDPDHWQMVREGMARAIDWLAQQQDAKWWIDHRHAMRNNLDSGKAMLAAIAHEQGFI